MKNFINSAALIILELRVPNKAPDLRYITVGISDESETDESFGISAIEFFKSGRNYPEGTMFEIRTVMRFKSYDDYNRYFKTQLSDYLLTLNR
jgi:hypothetical protein